MRIIIDGLQVVFPYNLVFNEQMLYMNYLKTTLDSTGHAILEMPTGTGKTICLLALLIAYLSHRDKYKKLIYCTRTVVEMEKTLKQLQMLLKIREKEEPLSKKFLCLGLTAKKNLCVHKNVDQWRDANNIETECKKRTAEWVRNRKNASEGQVQLCEYYENLKQLNEVIERNKDRNQVFTIQQLRKFGRNKIQCPYYTARQGLKMADIIVFNYLYLIDPQISSSFLKNLSKDTIVVFDEAHNIDDICIQSYTLKINKQILTSANNNITYIESKLNYLTNQTKQKYKLEINKVLKQLEQKQTQINQKTFDEISNKNLLKNIIPQNISNSHLFINSIKIVLQFIRNKIKEKDVRFYDNSQFRKQMELNTNLDHQFYRLMHQMLFRLINLLQINDVENLKGLKLVTFFCELIFTYNKGFKIIYQSHPMDGNISDPLLTLSCLDSSLSMQPIWRTFPTVILTSGTISPIELYPKLLNFSPIISKSINIQLGRNPINPLIIGRTYDQQVLSSQYTLRNEEKVAISYGALLRGLSCIVPDGILCFFPSYMYMEHIIKQWYHLGVINELIKNKIVLIEKKNAYETDQSIIKYRHACDIGRGAIFLAIARGKIAEGVDFQEHYGRCVLMIGFPVQNSHDPVLLQRVKFMIQSKQIADKNQFFEFDTMRQCAQCLGRVMRKKTDYGLMILADARFLKPSRYEKLPEWIKKYLQYQNINMTFQMIFHVCTNFFRKMGQQYQLNENHYKTKVDFKKDYDQDKQPKI